MGLRKNKSLIDQASETVSEYVEQVRPQVEAAVASAVEKAGPVIADVKTKTAPVIADAKSKAGPAIASGAAAAADAIAHGASLAAEKAAEAAEVAADKLAEVADAAEPEKKKGGKFKKFLLISGLAALGAFVFSKVRRSKESDNWQSSYTPTPAPPAPAPKHVDDATEDEAGATPGEAIADATEEPHPVTTPDEPAEVVDVEEK